MPRRREENLNKWLVVRCQLGEAAAFDELVEGWHGRLWSYVRRLCDDDERAEEALQETWLRILRGLPKLREPSRLSAWMHRIARNVVMDRLRGKYANPTTSEVDPDQLEGEPAGVELRGRSRRPASRSHDPADGRTRRLDPLLCPGVVPGRDRGGSRGAGRDGQVKVVQSSCIAAPAAAGDHLRRSR